MIDGLRLLENADLGRRNSFAVPAQAPLLLQADSIAALMQAHADGLIATDAVVLGGGSNLLWVADPAGAVVCLQAAAREVLEDDGRRVLVRAEAGCNWHDFVLWTVDQGLAGLENLALIPGTVGAAPIQNIGAYGVEVGEHIALVEALDRETGELRQLTADACRFGYRDSLFKHAPARWIVTAVHFRLSREAAPRLGYAGLAEALAGIDAPSPRQIADAVAAVRRAKLPDPAVLGNAGSFFKNPLVPLATAEGLQNTHPEMPSYPANDPTLRKLSAAWLIERSGWKGRRQGDAGVSDRHALVLVNHGSATGADLLALARAIATDVHARFGVAIEPEPRLIGATW
ncbi:MAG: UDP-N-acetylmuramate dehydrogenase [Pseudoxanthomonas suwonensis]|nr:UDP-N-acetylmuramate dehydrogenase [Pseudoxanthomonas suwonensis]